jgi:uncharacterized protein (DUF736 family)
MGANLVQPKGKILMATIGNFTADKYGFTGTPRNVKVKLVLNDKGTSENAPTSARRRPVTTSVRRGRRPARPGGSTCLEEEDGTHNLIWSRSKPQAS